MKKLIATFILTSFLKGVLLYLIILLGNLTPSIPGPLRFLMFILLLIFVDWKVFSIISSSFEKIKWLKLSAFSFGTFIMILFITGPLFRIHNKIFEIQPKGNAEMPNLIPFFIFGLVLSAIVTIIWTRKRIKN